MLVEKSKNTRYTLRRSGSVHLLKLITFSLLFVTLGLSAYAEQQVTRFGITWTFDRDYTVRRFVNGDYWVLDEGSGVTVNSVSPAPSNDMHGSVINPSSSYQGYDSRIPRWNSNLSVSFPKTLHTNDSLVSTISYETSGTHADLIGVSVSWSFHKLKTAAVLTVVGEVPPVDAFRPPYFGAEKPIFRKSDINYSLLPKLIPPQKISNPSYDFEDISAGRLGRRTQDGSIADQFKRFFERPWILHVSDWQGRQSHPIENMPNYHREVYRVVQEGAILSLLDLDAIDGPGELDKVLIAFLQLGIDSNYITENGGSDSSLGKWPIIFAGLLFNKPEMDGNPFPNIRTERQTYYIPDDMQGSYDGSTVPYGQIWTGYQAPEGKVVAWRQLPGLAEHEHFNPTDKDDSLKYFNGKTWGTREADRHINSPGYIGPALSAMIMGAEEIWNHPSLLDYVIRYRDGEGRGSSSVFVNKMWDAYRPLLDEPDTTPPSPPGGLRSTAVSQSRIDLSWDASSDPESGVSYYKIYRDGSQFDTSVSTSYSNIGLNGGTMYSYEVSAVNGQGLESGRSNTAEAKTFSDTAEPNIISVRASATSVEILFNEDLNDLSVEDINNNYSINNGISVIAALLDTDTVTLTTSSHAEGTYTLTVRNIRDMAGNLMPETTRDYQYSEGLVAHWKFDEETGGITPDDIGGNNGTLMNGANITSDAERAQVLSLDGVDDYVDLGAADIAVPWTASFWVKREDSANSNAALLESSAYSLKLEQYPNTNKKVGFTKYGVADYTFNYEAPIDSWIHLVFVGTQAETMLYVDGTLNDTVSNSISCPMARISNASRPVKGTIDDVRIYNRALTADEVENLFSPLVFDPIGDKVVDEGSTLTFEVVTSDPNQEVFIQNDPNLPFEPNNVFFNKIFSWTPADGDAGSYEVTFVAPHGGFEDFETITITVTSASGIPTLVGHWTMDDNAANTTVLDSGSYGNNGTSQWNTAALSVTGIIDGALSFDGAGDYINCGNNSSLDLTSEITISAWVKLNATNKFQFIGSWFGSNSQRRELYIDSQNRFCFVIGKGTGYVVATSNAKATTGTWQHIAASYNGSTISIYVDGVQHWRYTWL